MTRILLVEDEEQAVEAFINYFNRQYEIDYAISIKSALNIFKEKGFEYDLYVLDANLPDEDHGKASTPNAWKKIYRAIESELGTYQAERKTIILTGYGTTPGASGTNLRVFDKKTPLSIFEIILEQSLNYDYIRPNILVVMRVGEDREKIKEYFEIINTSVYFTESAKKAISAIKNGGCLYHLLLVHLDLPDKDLEEYLKDKIPQDWLLKYPNAGLAVLKVAHDYSPFTLLASIYSSNLITADLSRLFYELGLSATYIQDHNNLDAFVVLCYRRLQKRLEVLNQMGSSFSKKQTIFGLNLEDFVTLFSGKPKCELNHRILNLIADTNQKSALLFENVSVEVGDVFIESLCEALKETGRSCHFVDCSDPEFVEITTLVERITEQLSQQTSPVILGFKDLVPTALKQVLDQVLLSSSFETKLTLKIFASVNIENINKISQTLENKYNFMCERTQLPQLGEITDSQVRAMIHSYLLALGTYSGHLNISFGDYVFKNIRRDMEKTTALELWQILDKTFLYERRKSNSVIQINSESINKSRATRTTETTRAPNFFETDVEIKDEHRQVISELFKDYEKIIEGFPLRKIGKSGANLYQIRALFRPQIANKAYKCPFRVVKVNINRKIRDEYQSYEMWVRRFQDRNVARIENFVQGDSFGALTYTLARRGGESNKLWDFEDYFLASNIADSLIKTTIINLFNKILIPNWYEPSKDDPSISGFNWFYGKHLPPLLDVKINSDDDIFGDNLRYSELTDMRDEVWDIVDRVSGDDFSDAELLYLKSMVVPYYEERQEKSSITALHSCGAEVAIYVDQSEWDNIEKKVRNISKESSPIHIRGKFRSRQREVLSEIVTSGFSDINIQLDLSCKFVEIKDRTYHNPLDVYQKYLRQTLRSAQNIGIIHGDLHWRNVLVEADQQSPTPWLIDFGRTGIGPIIFDAIELETDLLVSVVSKCINESFEMDWYEFVEKVLDNIDTDELEEDNPLFARVIVSIRTIRACVARYLLPIDDWGNYYVGLCLYSLGLLRIYRMEPNDAEEKKIVNIRRRICFLIAAKAAEFAQKEDRKRYRQF